VVRRRPRRSWFRATAIATVLVITAAACGGGGGSKPASKPARPAPRPKVAGAVTVGAEEFPKVLNDISQEGSTAWTGWIVGPALARGYKVLPDFTLQPWIFAKDCAIASPSPFTVDCVLRQEAKWSDGVPLTADDFKFTFDTIMDPKNNVASRDGYDQVDDFKVLSPTEFQMVFKQVFAPFRQLWASNSTTVLPKHVLEGTDFNKVWNSCICDPKTKKPIGSGPMLVDSFTPDQQLTLVPNPNYWGPHPAQVKEVVFIPTPDTDTEVTAFRSGEVDMIYPLPGLGLRDKIGSVDGAVYQTSLGPNWEHFDMLSDVKGLDDLSVRKAIAYALPRQQLVDRLVKPSNDKATVLDNTQWMTNQKEYQPNWSIYPATGDVAKANQILDDAGWKLNGNVREKDGVKLQFTIGVTAGNQARELAEQVIEEQLKQIGVQLKARNSEDILDTKLVAFDYQTIIYAWTGAPDPFGGNVEWLSSAIPKPCSEKKAAAGNCDSSGQNYTKVRDPQVDQLLTAANAETDPVKRAALYNQVDQRLATLSVTSVPLFQTPTVFAFKNTITGAIDNSTQDGFTWNIEDWTFTG
jgi:peptide/nickel transport system substrate-binding protein